MSIRNQVSHCLAHTHASLVSFFSLIIYINKQLMDIVSVENPNTMCPSSIDTTIMQEDY